MRLFFAFSLLLGSLLALPAGAQPSSGPSEADLARAESLYESAKVFYNLREYEKALLGFKEAYLVSPEPELLLNIAQCHRFLKQYEEALGFYRTFLFEAPDTSLRGEVQRLIEEMERRMEEGALPASEPSSSSLPTSVALSLPVAPASEPLKEDQEGRFSGRLEVMVDVALLGGFTGVTSAAFLARNQSFSPGALFVLNPLLGGVGGAALGYAYTRAHDGFRAKEARPITVGALLGAGQGILGSRLLNVSNLGEQAVVSTLWFSTTAGAAGGLLVTELFDPAPSDSLLVASTSAFGTLLALGGLQLLPENIFPEKRELLGDLALSGAFNAGLLGGMLAASRVEVSARRLLLIDTAGVLGGLAGGLLGAGLGSLLLSEEDIGGAIAAGGILGGAGGFALGFRLTRDKALSP